ncbi:hypothetical protein HHK36_032130 [Tetracentron sinense]|uniref:Nudix hydrolase domain-containing protein n=1 Tax=Tetracentron sinense TaxID=13715 RepID=A0A834Y9Y4_TETSI|nr:hypothetical protein HHK36_032130 [Tetracentron sinense]
MDSITKLEKLEKKAYGDNLLERHELKESHILFVCRFRSIATKNAVKNFIKSSSSLSPHGITCKENLLKECEEEAGIPRLICILSNCTPLVQFVLNIHGYLLQLGCIAEVKMKDLRP